MLELKEQVVLQARRMHDMQNKLLLLNAQMDELSRQNDAAAFAHNLQALDDTDDDDDDNGSANGSWPICNSPELVQ